MASWPGATHWTIELQDRRGAKMTVRLAGGEAKLECPPLEDLDPVLGPYQKQGVAWLRPFLLALLREKLTAEGLEFCCLDGSTVDRAAAVDRFQNNSAIPVFLISLKAGGTGLNLAYSFFASFLFSSTSLGSRGRTNCGGAQRRISAIPSD